MVITCSLQAASEPGTSTACYIRCTEEGEDKYTDQIDGPIVYAPSPTLAGTTRVRKATGG